MTRERDPDDKGNRHRIKLKPGEVCPKCHAVHEELRPSGTPRCQSHARQNTADRQRDGWRQCKAKAVDGLDVCGDHGGSTPRAIAKSEAVVAEREAARRVADLLGSPVPVTDPQGELERLAGRMLAWEQATDTLKAELEAAVTFTLGTGEDGEGDPYGGVVVPAGQGLDVHPLVKLNERAQERSRTVLAEMVKLGFMGRRADIEESQAALLQQVLVSALTKAGVDLNTVMPIVAAELRALDDGVIDVDSDEVAP